MKKAKTVAFVALMAALANVMSLPPLAVPIQIGETTSSVHFFQLAIFLCGILAGPLAGLVSGAVGGLYMGLTQIPFIVGGIAILGVSVGFFSKKVRPVFASLLAWAVQLPYVLATDYIWFSLYASQTSTGVLAIIIPILLNLTLQAVVSAILSDILVQYIKRAGIIFQIS